MNGCAVCSAVVAQRRDLASGGVEVAERHERRRPARPSPRRGSRCRRAPRRGRAASVSMLEDLLERRRAVRPVGAHQHAWRGPARSPSRRAIAIASCGRPPRARGAPWKSSARASPLSSPTRSSESSLAERRRRLLEQLDGALVGDARAPAGVLVADRRAGEQLRRRPSSRAISAAARTPPARRAPSPARWRALAELEQRSRRAPAGSSMPSSSAVRRRAAASSKASAPRRRARRRARCTRRPRPGPPNGAAAAKWCARSASARPERRRRARAPPPRAGAARRAAAPTAGRRARAAPARA